VAHRNAGQVEASSWRHPAANGPGQVIAARSARAMVSVLRALAAAVVAQPGMDTATPRTHVAVVTSLRQPHVEAAAARGARLRVVSAGYWSRSLSLMRMAA
jgi:hypothetical protein